MFWRRLAIELFLMTAIGAGLALLGPFGTYAMPLAARLGLWIAFILLGYAIFRPLLTVATWLAETVAIPRWVALLVAGLIASVPLTALIGFAIGGMRLSSPYLDAGYPLLYVEVAGIGFAIQAGMRLLFAREDAGLAPAEPGPPGIRPFDISEIAAPERPAAPLLDRLPPELGRNLVCLEMQDHYVKAHTLAGSTMLLMRMRDAIAELGGIEGMQVHRSWWVARAEVRMVRREGRGVRLELANGLLAPVSRTRLADLKREGWL